MANMTRASILEFRDEILFKKHGRWLANYCVTVLSLLFVFALDRGIVKTNSLEGRIRKIKKAPDAPKANRALVRRGAMHAITPLPGFLSSAALARRMTSHPPSDQV